MLAWVVIDRTHSRQFLPRSSSLRTLCLCVEFSDSFRPTSVVSTAYALSLTTAAPQPLCNQSVTHSFYLDGGYTPLWRCPTTAIPSSAYPLLPISFIFNLVRTLLYFFALAQKSTRFFSSDSALFAKKRGEGVSQRSASSCGVLGNSAWSKWATLSAPRHASHESPVTSHQARTGVSQNRPKMEGLSLCVSAFDLESLAESAELELAMVFVLGRLVRPHHGLR